MQHTEGNGIKIIEFSSEEKEKFELLILTREEIKQMWDLKEYSLGVPLSLQTKLL